MNLPIKPTNIARGEMQMTTQNTPNNHNKTILVVDDDLSVREVVRMALEDAGYSAHAVETGESALESLAKEKFDLVVLDLRLPGMDGIEVLRNIKAIMESLPVVMITGHGTVNNAVEAMKLGAYDFVSKPFSIDKLVVTVRNAIAASSLEEEVARLRSQLKQKYSFDNIIGDSGKMQDLYEMMQKATQSDVTVLIQGESGTGKELIARAIHFNGERKNQPFVAVNCAAIPDTLLESELFGHEKGAFTGATDKMIGRFEQADGGTIFLDEIGEMNPQLQVKLLRVIQEQEIYRVGSSTPFQISTRIISATNKEIEKVVKEGEFREDLYYRLAVFPIIVPPLKERLEDIPLLAAHFLHNFSKKNSKDITGISRQAMELFMNYHWPGNVRELENAIERAVLLETSKILQPASLPMSLLALSEELHPSDGKREQFWNPNSGKIIPFKEIERQVISSALKVADGSITEAAKALEIGRATMYRKVREYGLT